MKKLVYQADTTSMSKEGYDDLLAKAFHAFDEHAKEEEEHQHPTLREKLSAEDNDVRSNHQSCVIRYMC